MRGAPRAHATRAKIIRSRRFFRFFFEAGSGGLFPEISRPNGAPSVPLRARARRAATRACARLTDLAR